jgi:hypothetical protein
MGQHRRARWPGLLLGTLFAGSVLLPELGHSVAHRHLVEPPHVHEHATAHLPDTHQADSELKEAHGQGSHLHYDARVVWPGKTKLAFLHPSTVAVFSLDQDVPRLPRDPTRQADVRADSWHGLSPPSRAPPLI